MNTNSSTKNWQTWGKRLALLSMALGLFGCVEINGNANVDAVGRVKVVTTYDFSKVFNNIKSQNPVLSDRMEGFDCKIFVSKSPNFKCQDEGLFKYKMSDEQDKPVGVSFNETTQELTVDAVKFFAEVTDLKSMVQRNTSQSALVAESVPPLLPLQSARREIYAKEGLSVVLKLNFANDIVSIDGQMVNNAGRELTINFMDIVDKPSYVIVTQKAKANNGTWLLVVLVLCLLALAVWFLWRKKNGGTKPPSAHTGPSTPTGGATAGVSEMDANVGVTVTSTEATTTSEGVDKSKPTRGERFAQAISAAAVGVGSSAVGGGANHTVEEVWAHEEVGAPKTAPLQPEKSDDDASESTVQANT